MAQQKLLKGLVRPVGYGLPGCVLEVHYAIAAGRLEKRIRIYSFCRSAGLEPHLDIGVVAVPI